MQKKKCSYLLEQKQQGADQPAHITYVQAGLPLCCSYATKPDYLAVYIIVHVMIKRYNPIFQISGLKLDLAQKRPPINFGAQVCYSF